MKFKVKLGAGLEVRAKIDEASERRKTTWPIGNKRDPMSEKQKTKISASHMVRNPNGKAGIAPASI
jgi:hypothetical protein